MLVGVYRIYFINWVSKHWVSLLGLKDLDLQTINKFLDYSLNGRFLDLQGLGLLQFLLTLLVVDVAPKEAHILSEKVTRKRVLKRPRPVFKIFVAP